MRAWLVAAGLIEGPQGLVLVRNRRRDGSFDWSPPGGVVEVHSGETVREGLSREVTEETGLLVSEWDGPVYRVEVTAEGLGWFLQVETYRAVAYSGELTVDDPDGIVVDAQFVVADAWEQHLQGAHRWVREPVMAFLSAGPGFGSPIDSPDTSPPNPTQAVFRYRLDGTPGVLEVVRLGADA